MKKNCKGRYCKGYTERKYEDKDNNNRNEYYIEAEIRAWKDNKKKERN